jgi:hypothetical protein
MSNTTLYLGNAATVQDASALFLSGSNLHFASGSTVDISGSINLGASATAFLPTSTELSTSSNSVVTLAYLTTAINNLVNNADPSLNTLGEIENFVNSINAMELTDAANIATNLASLNAEIGTRAAYDISLNAALSAEIARASAAEATEAARRAAYDVSLNTKIVAETDRASHAEEVEAATRAAYDVSLNVKIVAETTRATTAEAALAANDMFDMTMPCNSMVFSDISNIVQRGLAPAVMPADKYSYRLDGWYTSVSNASKKVNWFVPAGNLTVGDIKSVGFGYLPVVAGTIKPTVTIYTKPTGENDTYNSKIVFNQYASVPSAGSQYYAYSKVSGSSAPKALPGFTSVEITAPSGVVLAAGGDSSIEAISGEKVLAIVFSVGSTTASHTFELILNQFNVITADGTMSNKFSNDSVVAMQNYHSVSAVYAYLFGSASTVPPPPTGHSACTTSGLEYDISVASYGSAKTIENYLPKTNAPN